MCRSIKPLFNFDPIATDEEIRAAALQYVRKVSGYNQPSAVNQAAFDATVTGIATVTSQLLGALSTLAMPKSRDVEQARAHARAHLRYAPHTHK